MSNAKVDPLSGMHTVTPHLVCADANQAIAFYKKALGAEEMMRMPGPDGKVMHAMLKIGDSHIMLVDENPQWGMRGPKLLGGTAVTIHLQVPDCDASYARAVDAGATAKMPLADMFWGDRYGMLEDPYGHNWSIATHKVDLTPEQIMKGMMEQKPC
ncbi:MAG TPA: VOC family protein [Telluria sp.]|nr:VOC family protein [Telluria sp.]